MRGMLIENPYYLTPNKVLARTVPHEAATARSDNRGSGEMVLRRDDWLDVAREVNWTPRYVEERELFPEEISGRPWLTQGHVARLEQGLPHDLP